MAVANYFDSIADLGRRAGWPRTFADAFDHER